MSEMRQNVPGNILLLTEVPMCPWPSVSLLTVYGGNILNSWTSEGNGKHRKDKQNWALLTFRKAFFSNVFMINGGMAGSKDRPIYIFISCLFLALPPTPLTI